MQAPRAPLHPPWHANIGHVLRSTHQYAPKAQYAYSHGLQDMCVWCYTSTFCWTVSGLCCISTELTPAPLRQYARKYSKRISKYTQFKPPRSDNMLNTRGPVFPIPAIFFSFPVVTREATLVHPHKGVAVARGAPRSQKTTKGSDCSERAGLIIETTESWICNVQRCQGLAPCVGLSLRSLPMAPLPPTRCASIFWFRDSSTPLSSARHTARAPRWLRSAAQSSTQCPRTS